VQGLSPLFSQNFAVEAGGRHKPFAPMRACTDADKALIERREATGQEHMTRKSIRPGFRDAGTTETAARRARPRKHKKDSP